MAGTYQEGSVPSLVRALCRKVLWKLGPNEIADDPPRPSSSVSPLPDEQKLLGRAYDILLDLSPEELYPSVGTDKERQQRNLLSIGQAYLELQAQGLGSQGDRLMQLLEKLPSLSQVCLATEQQILATDGPLVKLSSHAELLSLLLSLRGTGSPASMSSGPEQHLTSQLVAPQSNAYSQSEAGHAVLWPSMRSLTDSPMEYHGGQQQKQECRPGPDHSQPYPGSPVDHRARQVEDSVSGPAQPASVISDGARGTGDSWIPDICASQAGDAFSLQVPGMGSMLSSATSASGLTTLNTAYQAALSTPAGATQDWVGPAAGLLGHASTRGTSLGSGLTAGARLLMQGTPSSSYAAPSLPYRAAQPSASDQATENASTVNISGRAQQPLSLPAVERYRAEAGEDVNVGPLLSSLPAGVLQMDSAPGSWTIFEASTQPVQDGAYAFDTRSQHTSHLQPIQVPGADADGLFGMESLLPTPKWATREDGDSDAGLGMRPSLGLLSSAASLGSVGLEALNSSLPTAAANAQTKQLSLPAVFPALGSTQRQQPVSGFKTAGAAPATQCQQLPAHTTSEQEVLRVAILALQGVVSAVHLIQSGTVKSPLLLRGPSQARAWSHILAAVELRLRLDALVAHYGQGSSATDGTPATRIRTSSSAEAAGIPASPASPAFQGDPIQKAFIAGVAETLARHTSQLQQLSQGLFHQHPAAGATGAQAGAAGPTSAGGPQQPIRTLLGLALWVGRSLKPQLSLLAALCRCTPVDPRAAVLGRSTFSAEAASASRAAPLLMALHCPPAEGGLGLAPSRWQMDGFPAGPRLLGHLYTELLQATDSTAPLLRRLFTACVGPYLVELRSWLFSLVMLPGQSTPPELPPFLTHLGHEIRMAGEQQRLLVQLAPRIGTLASRLSRLAATELHEARLVCSQATSSNRSVGGVGNGHEAKPSHVSHSYTLSGPATSSRQPASTGWGLDAAPVAMDLSWDLVPSGLTTPAGLECFSTGYIAPLGGGSTTDVSQPPDQQPKASKQLTAAKAAQQKEIAPAQGSEWASHLGDGFSLAFDMDVLQQVSSAHARASSLRMGEVDHVLGLLKRRRDAAAAAQDMELVAKALEAENARDKAREAKEAAAASARLSRAALRAEQLAALDARAAAARAAREERAREEQRVLSIAVLQEHAEALAALRSEVSKATRSNMPPSLSRSTNPATKAASSASTSHSKEQQQMVVGQAASGAAAVAVHEALLRTAVARTEWRAARISLGPARLAYTEAQELAEVQELRLVVERMRGAAPRVDHSSADQADALLLNQLLQKAEQAQMAGSARPDNADVQEAGSMADADTLHQDTAVADAGAAEEQDRQPQPEAASMAAAAGARSSPGRGAPGAAGPRTHRRWGPPALGLHMPAAGVPSQQGAHAHKGTSSWGWQGADALGGGRPAGGAAHSAAAGTSSRRRWGQRTLNTAGQPENDSTWLSTTHAGHSTPRRNATRAALLHHTADHAIGRNHRSSLQARLGHSIIQSDPLPAAGLSSSAALRKSAPGTAGRADLTDLSNVFGGGSAQSAAQRHGQSQAGMSEIPGSQAQGEGQEQWQQHQQLPAEGRKRWGAEGQKTATARDVLGLPQPAAVATLPWLQQSLDGALQPTQQDPPAATPAQESPSHTSPAAAPHVATPKLRLSVAQQQEQDQEVSAAPVQLQAPVSTAIEVCVAQPIRLAYLSTTRAMWGVMTQELGLLQSAASLRRIFFGEAGDWAQALADGLSKAWAAAPQTQLGTADPHPQHSGASTSPLSSRQLQLLVEEALTASPGLSSDPVAQTLQAKLAPRGRTVLQCRPQAVDAGSASTAGQDSAAATSTPRSMSTWEVADALLLTATIPWPLSLVLGATGNTRAGSSQQGAPAAVPSTYSDIASALLRLRMIAAALNSVWLSLGGKRGLTAGRSVGGRAGSMRRHGSREASAQPRAAPNQGEEQAWEEHLGAVRSWLSSAMHYVGAVQRAMTDALLGRCWFWLEDTLMCRDTSAAGAQSRPLDVACMAAAHQAYLHQAAAACLLSSPRPPQACDSAHTAQVSHGSSNGAQPSANDASLSRVRRAVLSALSGCEALTAAALAFVHHLGHVQSMGGSHPSTHESGKQGSAAGDAGYQVPVAAQAFTALTAAHTRFQRLAVNAYGVLREEAYNAPASSRTSLAAASYSMRAGTGGGGVQGSNEFNTGSGTGCFTASMEGRQVAAEILSHLDCEWYQREWAKAQARAGLPV